MLKRTILIMMAAMLSITAYAQKTNFSVKEFTKSNGVSSADLEKVRSAVINAIVNCEFYNVTDEKSSQAVADEFETNKYTIEGSLTKFDTQSSVSNGNTYYTGVLNFSISIIDCEDKSTVATATFNYPKLLELGKSSTSAAITSTLKKLESDIEEFMIEKFPLTGDIFGEDFEIKGSKLETCYINLGEINGVKKGDKFDIFEVKTRVGKEIESKIGRLKVIEVYEDVAQCEVTQDSKDVKEAMDRFLENQLSDPNTKPLRVKLIHTIWDDDILNKI